VGDIDSFVKSIEKLFRNPVLWSDMSASGHTRTKKNFSVESMGFAYLEIMQKALNGSYGLIRGEKWAQLDSSLLTWRDFVPNIARRIKRMLL
jgi:hypothetical protein